MRVLFVSREFGEDIGTGGIGRYVATMSRALAARGNEVHVLTCQPDQLSTDVIDRGVSIHRRPTVQIRGLRHVVRDPELRRCIVGAVSAAAHVEHLRGDFDVIETAEWMAEGLLLPGQTTATVVLNLHTPSVLLREDGRTRRSFSQVLCDALERWSVRRADATVSASLLLERELRERRWLSPSTAVDVIPLPTDARPGRSGSAPSASSPIVLAVGRLEHRKAPDTLLSAMAFLADSHPDAEAVLAGRSSGEVGGVPYGDWLASNAPPRARFRFIGEVRPDLVGSLYDDARVVVVASRFESFSLVALEAMAAGRPVIVTDRVGAGELLGDSEAGQVVPVDDVAALSAAIAMYLSDPQAADAAGGAGQQLVQRRCTPDRIAQRREAHFEAATAARHPHRMSRLVRVAIRIAGSDR